MRQNGGRRWRRHGSALAIALGLFALTACGGGDPGSSAAPEGGEVDRDAHLRVAYAIGDGLDPFQATSETAGMTNSTWPVYDRLLRVDTAKSSYAPMLATAWEFSEDGTELTLSLRDDVTFTDGTPFDAAAVKANLEFGKENGSPAYQANVALVDAVEVADPQTVVLKLTTPSTTILSTLGSPLGGIMVSPKALGNKDLNTAPVGTGAYVLEDLQAGETAVFVRREDEEAIWDDKTGKVAKITITSVADVQSKVNGLKSGQVDVAINSESREPLKAELDQGLLYEVPIPGLSQLVGINFNTAFEPFDDPEVRKAINLAIDRKSIQEAFWPLAVPRVQPWPDQIGGFDESLEDIYPYDPAQAKEVLSAAGYPDGVDGGELLVAVNPGMVPSAEAIQANLADVGIRVEVKPVDTYALLGEWPKQQAGLQLFYQTAPSISMPLWLDRLFLNEFWRPGGVDEEIAQLREGLDDPAISQEEAAATVGKALSYAVEEALYAPVFQQGVDLIGSQKVRGLDDLASALGSVPDLRNTYMVK